MNKNRKILINCINSHNYGGASYWDNFVKNFLKISKNSKINFFFIVNQNTKISRLVKKDNAIIINSYINQNIFYRFLYEQLYVPLFLFKKLNCDFYFGGKNIAPFLIKKKSIIVIRNIEPFYYYKLKFSKKKFFSFIKYLLTVISIKNCYKIISVSKNTKKIISKFTKKKILLIPNGAYVKKNYINKWSKKKKKNYILNSSKFISYANQLKLLFIYNKANKKIKNLPLLYFVGDVYDQKYYNKILHFIKINKIEKKIKFFNYLSKNKLHNLMAQCKLFVFSSELESCPQTILEARLVGCPILSNNTPPMPEFIGKNGDYFDINNLEKSANKLIENIYINKKKLNINKNLNKYNWENVCSKYLKVFNKL